MTKIYLKNIGKLNLSIHRYLEIFIQLSLLQGHLFLNLIAQLC